MAFNLARFDGDVDDDVTLKPKATFPVYRQLSRSIHQQPFLVGRWFSSPAATSSSGLLQSNQSPIYHAAVITWHHGTLHNISKWPDIIRSRWAQPSYIPPKVDSFFYRKNNRLTNILLVCVLFLLIWKVYIWSKSIDLAVLANSGEFSSGHFTVWYLSHASASVRSYDTVLYTSDPRVRHWPPVASLTFQIFFASIPVHSPYIRVIGLLDRCPVGIFWYRYDQV